MEGNDNSRRQQPSAERLGAAVPRDPDDEDCQEAVLEVSGAFTQFADRQGACS